MEAFSRRLLVSTACAAVILSSFCAVPAGAAEQVVSPKQLCLYYGWPSYVNGSGGDVTRATAEFSKCDLTVLGDGIEHTSHGDHDAATSIVSALRGKGKEVFGYVDLGVSTQNLSIANMQLYVDEWAAMGASGIFLDDAGYDYEVTRDRQNTIVDYIHGKGMTVFMNAWFIDDALADIDEAGRSNPSHLARNDVYLAESWLVAGGAYQSISEWAIKADKARTYARTKGVRIAGVSTAPLNKAVASNISSSKFMMSFYGAAMYNLAAWQWTDVGYSSGKDKLMFYNTSTWAYGSSFLGDNVTHLNSFRRNERKTNAGTIVVRGNGSSSGTGEFIHY